MPRPPLTTKKSPLIDTASYLLTEDGQLLLAEGGSDLLTTNPPTPLKRKKAPLVS